ncbi:MAG: PEP-CTERM sorting domain-containing protein [Planctomycetota bacterium]|nr:PEP-CTERM sorting domain-containing protein [Planctomycetota bacterium]
MNRISICIIGVFVLSAVAVAEPNIVLNTYYLQPNQTGQSIPIYVTGAGSVQGLEFNVRIGGGTSGPIFEDVDILTGTIFDGNNTGVNPGSYINPRDAYLGTTTVSGSALTDGLLATLTIDTTGLFEGQYSLSLIDTLEGRTNFAGVSADITDGSIIIIPEPTSLVLMLVGAGLIAHRRRNKSRH